MLPGTWAYVSAGAFGRAIIVSLYLVFLLVRCTLGYLIIIGIFYAFRYLNVYASFPPFVFFFSWEGNEKVIKKWMMLN